MFFVLSILATGLPLAFASPVVERAGVSSYTTTCNQIQSVISAASGVFFPGSATYISDNIHWVPNVAYNGSCTVQPGITKDIAAILGVLGSSSTPFAIKGGGHTGNPGFSSTPGVTVVMKRFNEVVHHQNNQTVDVGAGLVWDNVYETLDQHNVTVVGGRITGVGVAGFSLGGGYGWISNRYGLSIDNLVAYEIVTPTGSILEVNAQSYPDLFWALKGGFNNYGIVTKFTFKAIPIGQTWGGLVEYPASSVPAIEQAIADWEANVTDIDAALIATFSGSNNTVTCTLLAFYNAPLPPKVNNPFAKLLAIPQTSNTLATRSFYDQVLALSPPYEIPAGFRGVFASPRVGELTLPIIQSLVQQVKTAMTNEFEPNQSFSAGIEPFIPTNILKPITAGAWPHATLFSPTAVGAFWKNPANDAVGYNFISQSNGAVNATVIGEYTVEDIYIYPNYAEAVAVDLEDMYGPNLVRATQIAAKYDPKKVMTRSGGFIFQQA